MIKRDDAKHRARYTLEFKLEAVRLVKAGREVSVTARVLGMPKATLSNWVRALAKGVLHGAGDKPVSAAQMVLVRLRAELARVKMERDIPKNRFCRNSAKRPGMAARPTPIRKPASGTGSLQTRIDL